MSRHRGLTLVEMLVVVVIVLGVVAFFLVNTQSHSYPYARVIVCMSNVRNQFQAFVQYSSDNNDYFPGFDSQGKVIEPTVAGRYEMMRQYFVGYEKVLICSQETQDKQLFVDEKPITSQHFSYALNNISRDEIYGRKITDDQTHDRRIPIICDRAFQNPIQKGPMYSNHSAYFKTDQWVGHVAWLDGMVQQIDSPVIKFSTDDGHIVEQDFLFDTDHASMVYRGKDQLIDPGVE